MYLIPDTRTKPDHELLVKLVPVVLFMYAQHTHSSHKYNKSSLTSFVCI